MDAIKYSEDIFGLELLRVQFSLPASNTDRISIVSLLPSNNYPGGLGEQAKSFNETPSKRLFLFCYFFSALIDQAIHAGLRKEHQHFDNIAKYPKIVGILATYWHNMHPASLLLAATYYYTKEEDEGIATEDFSKLSDFFTNDYCEFFEQKYPKITGRLQKQKERKKACLAVLTEISNAMALLFVPQSLKPYSSLEPNVTLYKKWVLDFSRKINAKLEEYE